MRSFPSAARQQIVAATAAAIVSLGVLAVPLANADDDLEDRQKQVEGKIDQTTDAIDEASRAVTRATQRRDRAMARLATARAELADVRAELVAARERDERLAAELLTARASLVVATTRLTIGRYQVEAQHQQVTSTIRDYYTQGDPQLLAVASLMNSTSAEDLTRRMSAEDRIVGKGNQVYDDLTDAETELTLHEERVDAATEAIAANRREAAANLVATRDLVERSQAVETQVQGYVASARTARQDAFGARAADRAALRALRGREARIRRQILAESRDDTGGYTGSAGGILAYPTDGYVTSPYGYRTHPIYGYYSLHNGTDFGVGCGQSLVASRSGTVTNTYYDSVFGNRLFLNVGNVNGKNMTLVYNHLSGFRASPGQRVGTGEVVGYAGSTGWSTGCHLHFTVLVNGVPVDPMTYL